MLYLDIHKAFDPVPHNQLLVKLWQSDITGNLWRFLAAYLSDRQQSVCINGVSSPLVPVTPLSSGVPQGSILSSST